MALLELSDEKKYSLFHIHVHHVVTPRKGWVPCLHFHFGQFQKIAFCEGAMGEENDAKTIQSLLLT